MGSNLLFSCKTVPGLVIGGEICEDVWSPCPPSIGHALAGATVIVNCSASDETVGKDSYRKALIGGQSARLVCGYVYSSAGDGESTQDLVFGGHNMIAENGIMLAEASRFDNQVIYGEIDLERLIGERRRMSAFSGIQPETIEKYEFVEFELSVETLKLRRKFDQSPFVPDDEEREINAVRIFSRFSLLVLKRDWNTRTSLMRFWGFPVVWILRWPFW